VIAPQNALIFAVTLEVVAFVELWAWVNLLSAVLAVSATLFYVFVYTLWLKRTSKQNIVIGGAAGAMPVLVGWAAVTDSLAWAPVILFAVIFTWTPPANVPMMPVVASFRRTAMEILAYTIVMVGFTFLLAPVAHLGLLYLVAAGILGAGFIAMAIRLWVRATPKASMQLFSYSITYLTLLFVVMAVDVFITH
jgi:protoheme IX farnesyltransferase